MAMKAELVRRAIEHLRASDPVMRRLIDDVGPFRLVCERDRFGMLVRSIVSQQISTSAARSIRARLEALVAPDKITPENLAALSRDELRSAGISPQKAGYLHDLAQKALDGTLRLARIGRLSDEEVIRELIQVKGIGRWTAEMFLIFHLGRPDVLPVDDYGVRAAVRNLYGLAELPDRAEVVSLAQPWRPYASIASWYLWRSLEGPKKPPAAAKGYPV